MTGRHHVGNEKTSPVHFQTLQMSRGRYLKFGLTVVLRVRRRLLLIVVFIAVAVSFLEQAGFGFQPVEESGLLSLSATVQWKLPTDVRTKAFWASLIFLISR